MRIISYENLTLADITCHLLAVGHCYALLVSDHLVTSFAIQDIRFCSRGRTSVYQNVVFTAFEDAQLTLKATDRHFAGEVKFVE